MEEQKIKKGGLNLEPNEVIGYRISPDQWNWTVVIVKKHGKDSKNAGQEYKEALAYPKNLSGAISWIYNHVSALEGKKIQEIEEANSGKCADLKSLEKAFKKGEQAALDAVAALEKELVDLGINISTASLSKLMNKTEKTEEV